MKYELWVWVSVDKIVLITVDIFIFSKIFILILKNNNYKKYDKKAEQWIILKNIKKNKIIKILTIK